MALAEISPTHSCRELLLWEKKSENRAPLPGSSFSPSRGKVPAYAQQEGEQVLLPQPGQLLCQPAPLHPHHQPQPPQHRSGRRQKEQGGRQQGGTGRQPQAVSQPQGGGMDGHRKPHPGQQRQQPGHQHPQAEQGRRRQGGQPPKLNQQIQFSAAVHGNLPFFAIPRKNKKMFFVEKQLYFVKNI